MRWVLRSIYLPLLAVPPTAGWAAWENAGSGLAVTTFQCVLAVSVATLVIAAIITCIEGVLNT